MKRPELGMPADDVLKIPGYTKWNTTHRPVKLADDDAGMIVAWYYPGETLILKRRGGRYCVSEIISK